MKAILMTAAGKPEVLELQEIPQPIPTNKEILVKILALFSGSSQSTRFN